MKISPDDRAKLWKIFKDVPRHDLDNIFSGKWKVLAEHRLGRYRTDIIVIKKRVAIIYDIKTPGGAADGAIKLEKIYKPLLKKVAPNLKIRVKVLEYDQKFASHMLK
jgi:hypothetical protein